MFALVSRLTGDRRYAPRYYEKTPLYYRIRSSVYKNWTESENVSTLGVCFRTDQRICTGASVDVVMQMPKQIGASTWNCLGHVVRLVSANGWHGVALEFDCFEVIGPSIERSQERNYFPEESFPRINHMTP